MHDVEKKIIDSIKRAHSFYKEEQELLSLSLGGFSPEFCRDAQLKMYLSKPKCSKRLKLRVLAEYLTLNRTKEDLINIEFLLKQLDSPVDSYNKRLQQKEAGTYLLPVPVDLIRQVYSSGDKPLIELFQKHFPTPPSRLFDESSVPNIIQTRESETLKTLKEVNLGAESSSITRIQRFIRMQNRYQEEVNRIVQEDKDYLMTQHMTLDQLEDYYETNKKPTELTNWAEELMQDANKPYRPNCDPKLADRIMNAARQVAAFSTVKHITSKKFLQSIFDDGLYGRRTLMDFYLLFNPAALDVIDILNGDANVVCLGPQDIDPKATGDIVIEFDLPQLIKTKPAAFYKQRDLEYGLEKRRSVKLGESYFYFDHTGTVLKSHPRYTSLRVFDSESGSLTGIAELPKSMFIAYDLERMHEILTLNFFRFIDKFTNIHRNPVQTYIDDFYQKVSQLTDEELVSFLTDIEKNMTDTAEFNFYGAHQLEFSTIKNITERYKDYTLCLSSFIEALNQGNIAELRRARAMIPSLFQSYRFIDYLLEQVNHQEARYYLDDMRKNCKAPEWVRYTPIAIPDRFKIDWELSDEAVVASASQDKQKELPITNLIKILSDYQIEGKEKTYVYWSLFAGSQYNRDDKLEAVLKLISVLEKKNDAKLYTKDLGALQESTLGVSIQKYINQYGDSLSQALGKSKKITNLSELIMACGAKVLPDPTEQKRFKIT